MYLMSCLAPKSACQAAKPPQEIHREQRPRQ
jgi:hypothetical protein